MDGSDIEIGTVDSKMERKNLFPAFTKASEREAQKIKQDYNKGLCAMFQGTQGEKPKQTSIEESFQKEVVVC